MMASPYIDHVSLDGRAVKRDDYLWVPTLDARPLQRDDGEPWADWRTRVDRELPRPQVRYGVQNGNWRWDVPIPSTLPACAASSIAGAIEIALRRPDPRFDASVPYLYYYGRYLNLAENTDDGISVYNGLKAAFRFGVVPDTAWRLTPGLKKDDTPAAGLSEGATTAVARFCFLDRQAYGDLFLRFVKRAIEESLAVIFVASVTDEFRRPDYNPPDALIAVPDSKPANDHSLLAVAYDDELDGGVFWVRDSFGPDRGIEGYLKMPYKYFEVGSDLTRSFWVIDEVVQEGGAGWDRYKANLAQHQADGDAFARAFRQAYDAVVMGRG